MDVLFRTYVFFWWVFRIPYSVFRIPYSVFRIPYFVFRIPYSVFRIPYSVFRIPYSIFRIPYSVFRIPYSIFRIPYSVFRIPYSVFRIPYSTVPSSVRYVITCYPIEYLWLLWPVTTSSENQKPFPFGRQTFCEEYLQKVLNLILKMLREAWHVPGFATRARLRFSFLNSARHIVTETAKSSAQLSPALSEDVVWCSKQRVEINCLLHEISTEAAFTAEAHSRLHFYLKTCDSSIFFMISTATDSPHIIQLSGTSESMLGWDTYQLFGEN